MDDFDSVTKEEWDTKYHSAAQIEGQVTYDGNDSFVTLEDGNTVLKKTTGHAYFFDSTPKTGIYELKFDIRPAVTKVNKTSGAVAWIDLAGSYMESADIAFLVDSEGNVNQFQFRVNGEYMQVIEIDPTKWITFRVVRDFSTGLNKVSATYEGQTITGEETTSHLKTSFGNGGVNDAYIDNIIVRDYSDAEAPVLSAEDIKIYADDVEQKATKVSPFTDKIVIDFGQNMKKADMSEDCIWVEDEAGAKVQNAEYKYSDGVLTITYPDGFASGEKFTVKLSNVRNNGDVVMADVEKSFVTTGGAFAELVSITQKGNAVNSLADLVQGTAKINISYSNTENTSPVLHVIAAYYKAGALADVDFIKWQTSKDLPLINYGFNYMVPANDGAYDEVQFMVWEGFANLNPLSAPVTLK